MLLFLLLSLAVTHTVTFCCGGYQSVASVLAGSNIIIISTVTELSVATRWQVGAVYLCSLYWQKGREKVEEGEQEDKER